MKNTSISIFGLSAMAFVIALTVFIAVPTQAHAGFDFDDFNPLDPACIFLCDNDDDNKTVNRITNTYTNSNNVNSNINSPGSTVIAGDIGGSYYDTPSYDYDYDYDYPDYHESLRISCYPMPLSAYEGEVVRWVANVYGGNGSYHYSWSGTNGLSGSGSEISKRYNTSGYKNATVRVTSGSQTRSHNCDATVYIQDDHDDDYYPPPYYPPQHYPISVSCSVNPSFIQAGGSATWSAYATGGNGHFTYSWSGTDGLRGSGQHVSNRYYNAGTKYGTVTVYSGGQSITRSCGNVLTVGAVYQPPYNPYPPVYNDGLDIGCYADPRNPRVNQPITWNVEVTGGVAPYTYSWTGSDGLSGNQSSVIKYYSTTGEKSAIISVTSADGRTTSRACSHTVTVRPAASPARVAPQIIEVPVPVEDNGLSAAALFSLENVPWGWVAVLVILILFGTVLYLLFNKEKI